jgi:hypothetical protein
VLFKDCISCVSICDSAAGATSRTCSLAKMASDYIIIEVSFQGGWEVMIVKTLELSEWLPAWVVVNHIVSEYCYLP